MQTLVGEVSTVTGRLAAPAVALLSEKSELNVCHLTLLDLSDAADFFATRSGDYEGPNFYGGGWEH